MLTRCLKSSGRIICLLFLSVAVFTGSAAAQEPAIPLDPASVLNSCLLSATLPDRVTDDGIKTLPIEKLFVNGQTRASTDMLCIVPNLTDLTEVDWFRIDRSAGQVTKVNSGAEVGQFLPSPDGRYLAVYQTFEGHPWIEILDLPALMRDNTYKSIDGIGAYPGTVSIWEWKGQVLYLKSDLLLSGTASGRQLELLSAGKETFLWNVETGAIVPQSPSLQDPARYYCDKIAEIQREGGTGVNGDLWVAIGALGHIRMSSGAACLESALRAGTNEDIRAEIRAALEEIARATALRNDCLHGSRKDENENADEIVVTPIRSLFSKGRSIAVDNVLCIANPTQKGEKPIWMRLDRKRPDSNGESLEGGEGKVERMNASPDGKYLAVQYGDEYIVLVDLPMLLAGGRYKPIHWMSGSIKEWNDAVLEVRSDKLLSHAPIVVDDENRMLPLRAKESFLWDSKTATATPVWSALQNPVRYYCEGLLSPETENRKISADGLRLLKDKDAVPCIEEALGREPDETLRRELHETLAAITKP